jgi:short-subunit dehydrogenase
MQPERRCCLVTGATGGIGQALTQVLAAGGARLVLSGRDAARLEQLRELLPEDSVIDAIAADQLKPADLTLLAEGARRAGVNTLINLSGVNRLALFEDLDGAELATMIALNLSAPMRLTQLMLPHLKTVGSGMIVNVGSAFGSIGYPGYVAYCATKFGLRGFNEALRRELQDSDIQVLYVAPRATATAMNSASADALNDSLGNCIDPPEWVAMQIAAAIHKRTKTSFLGWPEKLFVKINGLLPGVVDSSLVKKLPLVREHARGGS